MNAMQIIEAVNATPTWQDVEIIRTLQTFVCDETKAQIRRESLKLSPLSFVVVLRRQLNRPKIQFNTSDRCGGAKK
jgi:hypothetical protein